MLNQILNDLDENALGELRELYGRLKSLYGEKASLEATKKSREDALKYELAEVCDIRDKEGNALAQKVQMPLVMAIIDELENDKPNKIELQADTMDIYRTKIVNKEVNESVYKGYIATIDEIKDKNADIKEVYKESSFLPKEVLDALNLLVKEEFKIQKEDALSEAGYESKPPRDKSEQEELAAGLKEVLQATN